MLWHQTLSTEHNAHITLMHGLGGNAELLRPLAITLSDYAQVTLIDLPGHGRSSAIKGTIDDWINALSSLIPKDSILIGWSLGGLLAMKLADLLPCKQLILLASAPRFISSSDWPYGIDRIHWQDFTRRITADVHQGLQYFFNLQTRNKQRLSALNAAIARYPITRQIMLTGLTILAQSDLRQQLIALTCPIHVILGKHDALVNYQLSYWYAKHQIAATVLPCDHLVFNHRKIPELILNNIKNQANG